MYYSIIRTGRKQFWVRTKEVIRNRKQAQEILAEMGHEVEIEKMTISPVTWFQYWRHKYFY